MSTNLRYIVQSNAFVVDKSKEVKKTKILQKSLPCADMIRTTKLNLSRAFHMGRTTKALDR
jgi:hypothetical protein